MRTDGQVQGTVAPLGSWAVAKDDGPGSKEMHMVYASPGTIAAYRKDGHFPDGTVPHGLWHEMSNGLSTLQHFHQRDK